MTQKTKKARAKKQKRRPRQAPKERASKPSTLPPGQAQRILDKLLLLEKVIPQVTSCKSCATPVASTPEVAP